MSAPGTIERLTDEIIAESVKNGLALLRKEHGGDDWADHIDLAKLDLVDGCQCVLGQVYGTYSTGCEELNIESYGPSADRFGFTLYTEDEVAPILAKKLGRPVTDEELALYDQYTNHWAPLTAEWRARIGEIA